jgi:large subunit ribosomal protein L25
MADNIEIKATSREVVGKANRRLGADKVPAVIYGVGVESRPVELDRHEFELLVSRSEGISARLIDLTLDGGKPVNVIAKAIQHDPTSGHPIHVDFWVVNMKQSISTSIQVHFLGEAPGVKTGGVMMHNLSSVQIESLPSDLPEYLEIDISGLEIGDSVHVRDLIVPKGVTILDSEDEIVASVVPPAKSIEEEEAEAAEAALVGAEPVEPELIGETPEEE